MNFELRQASQARDSRVLEFLLSTTSRHIYRGAQFDTSEAGSTSERLKKKSRLSDTNKIFAMFLNLWQGLRNVPQTRVHRAQPQRPEEPRTPEITKR